MNKNQEATASPQSSTQRAYVTLRTDIIAGRIPPGQRLKIDGLKETLDTGASPVREALSLLVSDQLVDRLDQRGFRVATTSRTQFEEILELRCNLESLALKDSLTHADTDWEDALVLAHHHMSKTDRNDVDGFERRHKRFHMTLINAAQSPILLRFCAQLYDLNVRYRYLAGRSKSYSSRSVANEHRAILDAAVNRNMEAALSALMDHYRNTGAFLAEQIEHDI